MSEEIAVTSILEMLSRIDVFYTDGKPDPLKLDAAAERMARRARQDPTLLAGEPLFQESWQDSGADGR